MNYKAETSAGGVVYKKVEHKTLWLVIQDSLHGHWGFPKGHVDGEETIEKTATREVEEETGVKAKIISPVMTVDYTFEKQPQPVHKTVHYFLMEYVEEGSATHKFETLEIKWLEKEEVLNILTFDNSQNVFRKALQILSS